MRSDDVMKQHRSGDATKCLTAKKRSGLTSNIYFFLKVPSRVFAAKLNADVTRVLNAALVM